ncbi:MAG: hypothetical protein J0H88_16215 [Sphingomonadales bacterium]|nr:hypothetical protein [Sphingomonadales bacterium]
MALVDPDFAEWLASEEISALATDAAIEAKWGSIAIDTLISSPLALKADAVAEAARQLAFRPGPIAVEKLSVPGKHIGMMGRVLNLTANVAGYEAGVDVFILTADETEQPGRTVFVVLRRL